MVCAKKSAATLAAAATSVYQSYSPAPTGNTGASGASSPSGLSNSTNNFAATTSTATVTAANSGIKGFNYGAFFLDYSAKVESDFEYEFQRAQDLTGTSGWSSARLYTMGK